MGGQMVGERLASRPRRRCYGGKKGPGDDRDVFGFGGDGAGLVRGAPGHGAVGVAEDVLGDILEAECELDSRRGRCHGRRGRAQTCALSSPIDQSIARAVFGSRVRPFLIKNPHIKVTV